MDAIDFSQEAPELLQLDFFERAQIEQVITNCEHVNEQGHTVCNVKVCGWLTDLLHALDLILSFIYYKNIQLIFSLFRHVFSCSIEF